MNLLTPTRDFCFIKPNHLYLIPCTFLSVQDIELSREINDSFRQSAQARLKLPSGIEMNVHVLTTGYAYRAMYVFPDPFCIITVERFLCVVEVLKKQKGHVFEKVRSLICLHLLNRTCSYWPTYPPMEVRLPHELNVYQVSSPSVFSFYVVVNMAICFWSL